MVSQVVTIDTSTVLYGFRVTQHPGASKGDSILQLLEASGHSVLLVRDFLERGQFPADASVLPRFWTPCAAELHSVRIALKDAPGQAGIILARRGLAPRVWTAKIVEARKTLLAADGRIVDANRHVIPRLSYELAGWPAGADAANIVQSTLDTTGTAVLPLRTFRNAGVHTWIVATEKEFPVAQFSIEIDGHVHQIIIQQVEHPGATKNAGKGGGKAATKAKKKSGPADNTPWPPVSLPAKASTESTRLDTLEARFDRLEQRQTHFEGKVDSKFDSVSDALRQTRKHQSASA